MMTHPLPDDVDASRLEAITAAVRADIQSGLYFGASIKVARHGTVVLDITEGSSDGTGARPIVEDSVFSIFSITKAFVNVLVLRWVELGRLALTTKMVDVIPEFSGAPRDRATIFHFLTHTTGMPGVWEPAPDLLLDVLEETVGHVVRLVHGVVEPGTRCDYSPMANHALLAAALVRTDPTGRDIATIMREELFDPLGMSDTALGIKSWMRDRHIEPEMRGVVPIRSLSRTTPGDFGLHLAESNESAWAGGASTAADLLRFAEMLRREGASPDGSIISPTTMRRARTNWTGDMPNELYRVVALRADGAHRSSSELITGSPQVAGSG